MFRPLMYEHKSSAFSIADMELENRFSLAQLDTNKNSISLLLVCVSLIFLMMCNNKLLVMRTIRLRIARPMCDGASSPPRLFPAWCVEASSFSAAFLFVGFCMLCLCRRQPLHERVPFHCVVNQTQCSRPCGSATY